MRQPSWRGQAFWASLCVCGAACGSNSSHGTATGGPDAGVGASTSADTGTDTSSTIEAGPSDATPTNETSSPKDAGVDASASYVKIYIATGYQNRRIVSFDDATTWVNDVSDPPSSLDDVGSGVAFGLGTVIVAGHTGLYTSTDAKNWTHLPAPLPQVWP